MAPWLLSIRQFVASHVSVTLGLLAAATAIGFIMLNLLRAAQPVATPVKVVNTGTVSLAIGAVVLSGQNQLNKPLELPAQGAGLSERVLEAQAANLAVGRPAHMRIEFVGQDKALDCSLEPRPLGACTLWVRLASSTQARCVFECQGDSK